MSRPSASRFAIFAILALAIGASQTFGPQGRAAADETAPSSIATAPALHWGFKETWRNYAQEPQVSDGAAVVAPTGGAIYDLEWTFDSGSYDPVTQTTRLDFNGSAHWRKYRASQFGWPAPPGYSGEPDPYILDVTLSDPQITISRDHAMLTVVASSRERETWELVSYGRVPIVNLDVLGITPTIADGTTTWAGVPATITAEGEAAMGGAYPSGLVVDQVGFSYSGPGGAPDFSEHWDEPGTAALKLVQNELFIDGDSTVNLTPLVVDRENQIVHSYRNETVAGVPSTRIEAFSLKQMRLVGSIVLPTSQAPEALTAAAWDKNGQRLLYRGGGENGMRRWLSFDPADGSYDSGLLADPQMGETSFFGMAGPAIAWDPVRDRGYRIVRVVPPGVPANEFDNHEWQLITYAEGEGGVWATKSFALPSFPTGQNRTGFPVTSMRAPKYATASDGSLIVLAGTRVGLDAGASIPGAYRLVIDDADATVDVRPLPGVEVLNGAGEGGVFGAVQTSANGHVLLIRTGADGEAVHCRIGSGAVSCDDPVSMRANVEVGSFDENRFALDPADGTVWFGAISSLKLAAVKDGAFRGAQFIGLRNPRGGPVLVGDDHFVYAQTSDGSPGELAGSKTWGYGKFERLGFVPTVTAQPQPRLVQLGAGESSKQVSFSSTASGEPAPDRQWQAKAPGSTRFADLAGETGETLSVAATRSDDGTEYRAVYSNAAGKLATDAAALSVEYAPLVRQSPASVKALEGTDAEFAVLPAGNPEPAVTWQRKVGGFWQDIGEEDESIVAEGNSLTVVGASPDQSGTQFRARLDNSLGMARSEAAKLTVTPKVAIPPGGVDLNKVELEWSGSAELQKAPPFGGSNYFSAGVSHGDQASFKGYEGNAFALQVAAGGAEAVSTWATRAGHVTNGGAQLVRLYRGIGTVAEDGSATVAWDGSFSVNFYGGLAPFTISDPALTVDADGEGVLSADLLGCASSMANPSQCTPLPMAHDVTVATFSGVEVDPAGELTVKPDYAGVEAEVPSGTPQNRSVAGWGAWPQPFVDFHVQTGLAAYWYSSGGIADPDKPPAPFTVDFVGGDPPVVVPVADGGGPKPAPAALEALPAPAPPSIGRVKGVQAVGPKRRVKVATLRCPGSSPCTVQAPRNAPIRIGGRTYWAAVFAPRTIPAAASATVRARLAPRALAALGQGRATLRVRLQVRSDEGLAKLLARVPVRAAG